jgi:signal transduction histidine kinase
LSPAILEDLGLTTALRKLVATWARDAAMNCSVEIADIDHKLSKKDGILLYRILQEALTNIELHSDSNRQSVVITETDGVLSMLIQDDGRGFDPVQVTASRDSSRGIGLAVMEERARMLGGSLLIWSEPGKGARLTLTIANRGTQATQAL